MEQIDLEHERDFSGNQNQYLFALVKAHFGNKQQVKLKINILVIRKEVSLFYGWNIISESMQIGMHSQCATNLFHGNSQNTA